MALKLADLALILGFSALMWGLWGYDPRLAWIIGGGLVACGALKVANNAR